MKRHTLPKRPAPPTAPPEVQQSARRSIAQDERVKRALKQHPQREEPKVDSVELGDTPP